MSTKKAVETPFAPTQEGRDTAIRLTAEHLAELGRDQAVRKRIRDHLHGRTPIGEALSFFYSECKTSSSDAAARDLTTADRVVVNFFTDTGRYREAREAGSLQELVSDEVSIHNHDRLGAAYVTAKLHEAFDAVFAAEQGEVPDAA